MGEKIIHKELSYLINGCIFDVHNEIGPGVREECYQEAMEHRLGQAGLAFLAKPRTRTEFIYRGQVADIFEPDLIVLDQIIIELKHQPEGFSRDQFTQVLNYLKFWDLRLGLLLNFAMDKALIERIPFEPRQCELEEDYDYIREFVRADHRPILATIRESLLEIHREIGAGYGAKTYRNLAIIEFRTRGLTCASDVAVTPVFRDRRLPTSWITPLVIEGKICVQIEAIYDDITARAVRTMQTHLRLTGCELGIIACFGKNKFLIRGVRK